MKQTDEQIAKEYADGLVLNITGKCDKYARMSPQFDGHDLQDAYSNGILKGRESEAEKSMRFAEYISECGYIFNRETNMWGSGWDKSTESGKFIRIYLTTEKLYNSQEFKEYLKQFEK